MFQRRFLTSLLPVIRKEYWLTPALGWDNSPFSPALLLQPHSHPLHTSHLTDATSIFHSLKILSHPKLSLLFSIKMSRFSSGVKSGEASAYDEIMLSRKGQDVRHAPSRMPWYNPRYWRKRVWAGVATIVVIIIIIIVAVAVSQSRKNRYPDYSPLEYSLADTCRSITAYIQR
jgi:hypothetical protein